MDGEEARTYVEKLHPKDSRTQRAKRLRVEQIYAQNSVIQTKVTHWQQ